MQHVTLIQSYTDPVFEDSFKKLEDQLLSMVSVQARQDGLLNKPANQQYHLIKTIMPVKLAVQKNLDFNFSLNQPKSNLALGQRLWKNAAESISLREKERNAKEKEMITAKGEQQELKSGLNNWISSKLRIIIPAVFGFCEGILVYNILQGASYPGILKFFLSAVIALSSCFGLHLGASFIRNAVTKLQARTRFVIVTTLALLVAIGLGFWRATLYNETVNLNSQVDLTTPNNSTEHFSPFPFILISFISFLVGLAFELEYWVTNEEKKKQKLYEEKSKELLKIQQEFTGLQKNINDIKHTSTNDSAMILRKQEYGLANERRLAGLAQKIVNHYESVNIEFRMDGDCPAFFNQIINKDFQLYFTDVFDNVKQQQ